MGQETTLLDPQSEINVVWTCVAAFPVFFMHAGFAMVESGSTRAKNTLNILMKNLMDFSKSTLSGSCYTSAGSGLGPRPTSNRFRRFPGSDKNRPAPSVWNRASKGID